MKVGLIGTGAIANTMVEGAPGRRNLLRQLLHAKDYRVRAAAVEVVRFTGQQLADQGNLLMAAAKDDSGRVRLESIVAASWLDKEKDCPL